MPDPAHRTAIRTKSASPARGGDRSRRPGLRRILGLSLVLAGLAMLMSGLQAVFLR